MNIAIFPNGDWEWESELSPSPFKWKSVQVPEVSWEEDIDYFVAAYKLSNYTLCPKGYWNNYLLGE